MKSLEAPKEIQNILAALQKAGFEAYAVGGCARDLLMGRSPADWDITTNAMPEQIQKIFPDNFCENKFGTVSVITQSQEASLKNIEITPFRIEAEYSDRRHPDQVKWAKTLEEDLSRRDFTVNAIALRMQNSEFIMQNVSAKEKYEIIDPFEGQKDLKNKVIRAVGDPQKRFNEDALRLMRAVRFASILGFKIEAKTQKAILENAGLLKFVSQERIRDELVKIIMSDRASFGIEAMRELGLLQYVIPELLQGYKVGQNKHHVFDCYEHALKSLEYAAKKGFNKYVRIASLLHDIGKPATKRGNGRDSTFYGHEVVGARMAKKILERLKFSNKDIEKITLLARYHLFYYNAGEVTDSSVRRLMRNAGKENMEDLLYLRQADRIGSGCPKAEPYKLRHLKYVIDKVSQDPISAKMLEIDGSDIMRILNIDPGRKIGQILDIALDKVLSVPELNSKAELEKMVKELDSLPLPELERLAKIAKENIGEVAEKRDENNKSKYWVK